MENNISQVTGIKRNIITRSLTYEFAIGLVIGALGVLFRSIQYIHNRSLWLDEAMLAMNLLDRSFRQLLQPLDYNQAAPIGFLFAVKMITKLAGASEFALRLIPFVSSILLLPLFYYTARKFLSKNMALAGLFFISFSPSLIYYASEFKPYASDALICLSLFLLAINFVEKNGPVGVALILGAAGALASWFSYPAVFVLAGIGLTLAGYAIHSRNKRQLILLAVIGTVWLASFVLQYFISLHRLEQNQVLDTFWQSYFAPFPPHNFADIQWYIDHSLDILQSTTRITLQGLVLFGFLLGSLAYYRQNRLVFFLLVSSLPFLLAASALHRYPIIERMLIFFTPFLFLILLKGVEYLRNLLVREAGLIAVTLLCLMAYFPTYATINNLIQPPGREEVRPAMQYAREHWQSGDTFYVYFFSIYPFDYYSRSMQIPASEYVLGTQPNQGYEAIRQEITQLKGRKRVWFLFSHLRDNNLSIYLYFLHTMGKELQAYQAQDAAVYLFDLSGQ